MATQTNRLATPRLRVDAAHAAVHALRKDFATGGRALTRDVRTLLRSSWRDTSKLAKAVRRDVGRLMTAFTGSEIPAARPRAASRKRVAPTPPKAPVA